MAVILCLLPAQQALGELLLPDSPPGLLLHAFDFEERDDGNFESMPMFWYRVREPGYADYTTIELDPPGTQADKLKLQLKGSSAAVVLEPGHIVAIPGSRYAMTARVRTQGLRVGRVRISAAYINGQRELITGAETISDPILSEGQWRIVRIDLPPAPTNAAWITLRLELVQPEQFLERPLGPLSVREQDIEGTAWFDDIAVWKLSQIRLHSENPYPLYRAPAKPAMQVNVRDLAAESGSAVLTLFDMNGRRMDEQVFALSNRRRGPMAWQPNVSQYGWYLAELVVESGGEIRGKRSIPMVYLPPAIPLTDQRPDQFLLDVTSQPADMLAQLPTWMRQLEGQGVILPVWQTADAESAKERIAAERSLVSSLMRDGRQVTLSIGSVPAEIAAETGVNPKDPLALLAMNRAKWVPHFRTMLGDYGYLAQRWVIGEIPAANPPAGLTTIQSALAAEVSQFVQDPQILFGWTMDANRVPPGNVSLLRVRVPAEVRPDQIRSLLQSLPGPSDQRIVQLQSLLPEESTYAQRVQDLAMRTILTRTVHEGAMAIDAPWRMAAGDDAAGDGTMPGGIEPDPLLPAWMALADRFAGRGYVGTLDLHDDVEAHLFDGRGGMIAFWTRSGTESADVRQYLGPSPMLLDIMGNGAPLQRATEGEVHALTAVPAPQFIENVDVRLLRFRASFAISPEFAPSEQRAHKHVLKLNNPWDQPIGGTLRIVEPSTWEFDPMHTRFHIEPGASVDIPVQLSFPIFETVGKNKIIAQVELDADRHYSVMVSTELLIGLPIVEFVPELQVVGDDVIITSRVTNLGDQQRLFSLFSLAPGVARRQQLIGPLAKGESERQRIVYAGLASQLRGQKIRVSLRDVQSTAVLNHVLQVPGLGAAKISPASDR